MATATKLNVIALISGGKDSLFSILHCQSNGHEVVALANLYPPPLRGNENRIKEDEATDSDSHNDDIDSYMYQTVGHTVIPLYEEALGIPLYRQEIVGSAVNKDKSYARSVISDGVADDEIESLVPLLQKVLKTHPEANAVSTGAILSDYQRTRIESIAIRLGLVPLSYLWQFPYLPPGTQRSLLDDMDSVGQDVRIIKIASGGLDESFLWKNLVTDRVKRSLATAMGWFGGLAGGALLGEGGEYETLAIDGPPPLWKKRIRVDEDDQKVIDHGGGSVLLRFGKVALVPKMHDIHADTRQGQPRIPALLDQAFADLLQHLANHRILVEEKNSEYESSLLRRADGERRTANQVLLNTWQRSLGLTECYISNIVAPEAGEDAKTQMKAIAAKLTSELQPYALNVTDIVLVTILLRSMADYATVNQIYGSLFTKPNPPARITVGCGGTLPDGIDVMLAIVAEPKAKTGFNLIRKNLHVQSISYWAPANIGPYSQAISVPTGRSEDYRPGYSVYVAGQIPLVPASMELVYDEKPESLKAFRLQTVLSLQHLWRIGKSMEVQWWAGVIAFIAGDAHMPEKARIVSEAWEHVNLTTSEVPEDDSDQDESIDIDLRQSTHILPPLDRQECRCPLPDPSMLHILGKTPLVPPLFVVQVDQLPRGASIEWAPSLGISNNKTTLGYRPNLNDRINICYTIGTRTRIIYRGIDDSCPDEELDDRLHHMIGNDLPRGREGFETADCAPKCHSTIYTARPWGVFKPQHTQIIPCRSVWGRIAANEWGRLAAGVVRREERKWPSAPFSTRQFDEHFDEAEEE
ncbi:MAG: hypothetical protein M1812_000609 [Candelaria pacifica]|nr:MAG: hypothetical protein M1812_000609 [Candelaria pacifica]